MQIQPGSLQFTDYLKQLPPAWVIDHFFSGTTEKRKILSSAMIEEIAGECAEPAALCRRFHSLPEEQRLRCAAAYFMGTTGCATASAVGIDDPIVEAFLGYAARSPGGETRIFGFSEFASALQKEFTAALLKPALRESKTRPAAVWRWRSCNDIAMIATMAEKQLLLKKRSGKFGMVLLQQVKRLIHTADFYKNEDVETILRAVIGYCCLKDLFSDDEELYRCRPEVVAAWLAEPVEVRSREVGAWFAEHCGGWNIPLLRQLCSDAGHGWLSTCMFSGDDQRVVREVLVALQFSGLIEVRKIGTELCFTLAPPATSEPVQENFPVLFMPDFTVIVPQESLPETVYGIARFCRIDSLDKVYHGVIEKSGLTEALAAGMPDGLLMELLERWNAPVNIKASVQEWIREFFRVSLSNGQVLIVAEERVTDQIAAFPQLTACLERVSVHSVFRIRPGMERQVADVIKGLGFDARIPVLHPEYNSDAGPFTLVFPEEPKPWWLITENDPAALKNAPAIRGSKYGASLKSLDLSETVQVIDYAILTGQKLMFTYEGSPYVRKGTYTVTPVLCSKGGAEPLLDGELQRIGTRKQFYIKKISSIGVAMP
jgi:hypothetical protein